MDKLVFSEKLSRWMDFSKSNGIRKSEAWPFWFQFSRMFGLEVAPLHFWRPLNIYLYFYFAAFVPWIALVQYFTRNFLYNGNVIYWDNLGISAAICLPISLLLGWNITNKKRKLDLHCWETF